MKRLLQVILLLFVLSCGKSPFLAGSPLKNIIGGADGLKEELRFETDGLSIERKWETGPTLYNSSKITILLKDSAGNLRDPQASFLAYLWMPNMNHGSFPITITRVATGTYELDDVYFTMNGVWDFHLQLAERGNIYDEVSWRITL